MFNRAVLIIIIYIEIGISLFVIRQILIITRKKHIIFHSPNVIHLDSWNLVFPTEQKDPDFTHYFEPKPDIYIDDEPSWLGHKVVYSINTDGLNEQYNYSLNKNTDTYRIVAMGDSFTYGLYVNTVDTYPKQLEAVLAKIPCKKYKKIEVINLGVPAHDIPYAIRRFQLHGKKYHPDLVLWFLKTDDFDEIAEDIMIRRDSLTSIENPVSSTETDTIDYWDLSANILQREQTAEYYSAVQNKSFEKFKKSFTGKLVIFSFPFLEFRHQRIIEEWKSKRPLTFLHTIPDIYQQKGNFPDTHPNELGYKIIALDLKDYLLESKIVQCE